jgi:hypothetical protein
MTELLEPSDGTGTIEVRVFRDGELIARTLVETEAEAETVVEAWSEQDAVHCEVDDVAVRHRAGQILEPDEPELTHPERYPSESEGG